ncbi:hypothetical protein MKK88_21245 [Methylobacterium sp. E-005]|uniref:hypothetical protein n=1 Tax=Methylobacterium sp. E-005 TaxID=2836549 RepID=UPI001FB8891C|nr:hypothetical protein [Methylobacterium sp. E-005]MCJ2088487.1 hypothetical protein [Methylobacterium sp. E-005]
MYHTPSARLNPFAERLMPEADLARLSVEYRTRVNGNVRAAHIRVLHPNSPGYTGKVTLMRQTDPNAGAEGWTTKALPLAGLAESDPVLWATHVSMQRFHGSRRTTGVAQVQAFIADVETHTVRIFDGMTPEDIAGVLIERIEIAGLPLPSYVLFSGRGHHVVWLHEPHNATAEFLSRWRACQRFLHGPKYGRPETTVTTASGTRLQDPEVVEHETRMADLWRGTGLDRNAADIPRVLRLAGSYNPKSQQVARLVWPASWTDVVRHDYETLATAFLPFSRDQMQAIRAERQAGYDQREAARQAKRAEAEAAGIPVNEPKPRRRKGNHWAGIVEALDAIRLSWGGEPPEGRRDWWAFLSACAMAQSEGGTAETWAARLAGPSGLPETELRANLGSLERALRRSEAGETSERGGVERTVVYSYAKVTMLARLGLTEEQVEHIPGAEALLPRGVRQTERERSAQRRTDAGCTPQVVTVSARLADGRKALAMRQAGRSIVEIERAFEGLRGRTSLYRAIAEAEAETATSVAVEPAIEHQDQGSVDVVHGPTVSIVAEPGPRAPSDRPTRLDPVTPAIPGVSTPDRTASNLPPSPSDTHPDMADAQGSPLRPLRFGMSEDTGPSPWTLLAASPGPSSGPVRDDRDMLLPEFLADIFGVLWTSQLPVGT